MRIPPLVISTNCVVAAFSVAGFEKAMKAQRERSRRGMKQVKSAAGGVVEKLPVREIEFLGYQETRVEGARILALLRDDQAVEVLSQGDEGQVLLDRTPFYAEAGGQLGDSGFLTGEGGVAAQRSRQEPGICDAVA